MSLHHLAGWLDNDGHAVSYTSDSFICLAPVQPRDFAGETADGEFETTFRCRDCIGCRNYEALILRRRLALYFLNLDAPVWIVEFTADKIDSAKISAAIARAKPGYFLPGYLPVADGRIAKIRVGSKPAPLELQKSRLRQHRPRLIQSPTSARAWKRACRGMKRPRVEIGANRNRYYLRDLPRLPRENFMKCLYGGIRKSHPEAKAGVRAWRRGLSLYPSEVSQGKAILASILASKSAKSGKLLLNHDRPKAVSELIAVPETRRQSRTSESGKDTRSFSGGGGASCPTRIRKELDEALASLYRRIVESGKT